MNNSKKLKLGLIPAMTYKGFTVLFLRGKYFASSYASPEFYNTNFSKLKKEINQHLKKKSDENEFNQRKRFC
tara:strand:- start:379 stop:594 length:216 start_codon:yes stop_codon:yes gene_type:complete